MTGPLAFTIPALPAMECVPALDLRGGRCVRLLRGDFAAETVYGDPVEQAEAYRDAGATSLHVVDLDAARTGEPVNRDVVLRIVDALPIPVQLGGGIRDAASAAEALEAGVSRVVLGTVAVEEPEVARRLAERYPGRVVLGLDHRRAPVGRGSRRQRREVALRGWKEGSGIELTAALAQLEDAPLGAVIVTDIDRDGTLEGPDLPGYELVLGSSSLPIVASGGIGGADDLRALAALEIEGRRLAGAIVGRALLSGVLSLEEAMAACAR
ncbi:MAG TPA: 1-(5-phosphoribosyl)-5-[(5-phosphoribosylamino)methylideneamino] imidazole-4-carboxamide isomerase [Acidimicrobiales bacterium]|nr:1-(5-phosphoribosyl)-5-[(5-phosphoribosylamino)methylideneamino] imidazole-4-carboxamide isomerase [Acidimicrobiales bacterium]